MSRIDKYKEKKYKSNKIKVVIKILFLTIMIVNTAICTFIVDKNAQNMLTKEGSSINRYINESKDTANVFLKNLNKIAKNAIEKFNK